MKPIYMLALLASLLTVSAPAVEPALPGYQEFDQMPGKGWRSLADQKHFSEAVLMIESFLAKQPKLTAREKANLHFHAAQCLAIEGSATSITTALGHLLDARVNPEPTDSPVRWNEYVTATEAFLKSDLPALKAARDRMAAGPKLNGEVANLDVVDRLITKFGKSYAEAYLANSIAEKEAAPSSTPPKDDAPAGIGIALIRKDGNFYVGKLLPDSAAIVSQLIHQGDRILAVGEGGQAAQPVTGRSIEDVVTMIRGKEGTRVRLTVVSADADVSAAREVLLTRGKLKPLFGLHYDARLLNPGSQAPDLPYLRLSDQQQASLAATHRGKIVVVEFWATWCGPCQHAMADLQKTAAKFASQKDKIDFLAISIDGDDDLDASKTPATIAKVTAHLKQKGWTYTINGWSTFEQLNGWRISAVPTTYIIGADGKVIIVNPEQKLDDVIAALLMRH